MDTRTTAPFPLTARADIVALRNSKIREVANAGIGLTDVLPFWFGEPDEVTPQFIRQAGIAAIERGETFYTQNFGIPELRSAISTYVSGLHGPIPEENIAATTSGMSALMLAVQALVGAGDRVVAVTPLWPNLVEIPKIMGASVETVSLDFHPEGWRLDMGKLFDAVTPGTCAVMINSPNNPTGWTMDSEDQAALLAHCRRLGIWIIADDAYERIYFEGEDGKNAAPSFLDLALSDDRVVSTNTFSKSWLMTGWRLGWVIAPPMLIEEIGKIIEYNTSCIPGFVQHAGVAAITQGEPVIAHTVERYRKARDFLVGELRKISGIEVATPSGAMYAFFRVEGMTASLEYSKRLVRLLRRIWLRGLSG
jgi:aspartate/methionine/tyrosine aminotransferase